MSVKTHICEDCGREFKSGSALGGHRRIHTQPEKYGKNRKKYKAVSPDISYQPTRPRKRSYAEFSDDEYVPPGASGRISAASSMPSVNRNASSAVPARIHRSILPPPKKVKRTNPPHRYNNVPVGVRVKPPTRLQPPTAMDALREQIGIAIKLYHFDRTILAKYAGVPLHIFEKWLQGGIKQRRELELKSHRNEKSKSPLDGLSTDTENGAIHLNQSLSEQISLKMTLWVKEFMNNGFFNSQRFDELQHYKKYKSKQTSDGVPSTAMFDSSDDSSFFYNADMEARSNKSVHTNRFSSLLPIRIHEIVNGKTFKDNFLWDPNNSAEDLREFTVSLCEDWGESDNTLLRNRLQSSMHYQISLMRNREKAYLDKKQKLATKQNAKANNYLQHLQSAQLLQSKALRSNLIDNPATLGNIGSERGDISSLGVTPSESTEYTPTPNAAASIDTAINSASAAAAVSTTSAMTTTSTSAKDKKALAFDVSMISNLLKTGSPLNGHILITLNIAQGSVRLTDQFLWNLNDEENNPESFAKQLCSDLGISFLFAPDIAYAIRTQCAKHQAASLGRHGGLSVDDPIHYATALRAINESDKNYLASDFEPKLWKRQPLSTN